MPGFDTPPPTSSQFVTAQSARIAAIMAKFTRRQRDAITEFAIALADAEDGDPDLENATNSEDEGNDPFLLDDGPGCAATDTDAASWPEFSSLGRHKAIVRTSSLPHEDAEIDDDDAGVEDSPQGFDSEEDCCLAGDDRVCSGAVIPGIYGNKYDGPGDAEDAEREQLPDDVPCLAVYSLEPNLFDGKRQYLGHSNLKPSFVSGRPMKAAD